MANIVTAVAAATIAGAAYLNAKFHVAKDVSFIYHAKKAERQTLSAGLQFLVDFHYSAADLI